MKNNASLIEDIIQAIESIESYHVSSYEIFVNDEKTQDAIMYNLTYRGSCKPNHQRISREPPANSLGIDYWNKKCDCSWL